MTKKMVNYEKYADDLIYAETLGELQQNVEKYIAKYGKDVKFDLDSGYLSIAATLTLQREETDKEYNKRLKDEAREKEQVLMKKQRQEEKERKELERLKKKYGE